MESYQLWKQVCDTEPEGVWIFEVFGGIDDGE